MTQKEETAKSDQQATNTAVKTMVELDARLLHRQNKLTYVPGLLLIVVGFFSETIGIWLGFGVNLMIVALQYFRSVKLPEAKHPKWYWQPMAFFVASLACGIAHIFDKLPYNQVVAIIFTAQFAAIVLSLIFKDPCVYRRNKAIVGPKIASTPAFMTFCRKITLFKAVDLFLWCTCLWISELFVDGFEVTNQLGYNLTTFWIPLVLNVVPFILEHIYTTMLLVNMVKELASDASEDAVEASA